MAQPQDWLGPLIEDEIRSVISWKRSLEGNPKVKRDPDGRFEDDGSNFRSIIKPSVLTSDSSVQVCKILSLEDPTTLSITDGFTRVKAKLSARAVDTLEAGIGESLDLEMKGDVFFIREATVQSTPIGPTSDFIQLAIENIEYFCLLRKSIGNPVPIEDKTTSLIEQIRKYRLKQYTVPGDTREESPDPLSIDNTPSRATGTKELNYQKNTDTPKSQRLERLSQFSSPSRGETSPTMQRVIATQVPTRRKPNGPTLPKDGFEIEEGVNLSRPTEARSNGLNQSVHAPNREKATATSDMKVKLLGLLGNPKVERAVHTELLPQPASTSIIDVHQNPVQAADHVPVLEVKPVASPHSVQPTSQSRPVTPFGRSDYTRRRIPRDQQKLLEQPSSWLPSLPGQRFPRPNIPIKLLERWNTQVTANAVSETASSHSVPHDVQSPAAPIEKAADSDRMDISNESSPSSSSNDEELSASQWPPTPPPAPVLPPDSSVIAKSQQQSPVTHRPTYDGNSGEKATSTSLKRLSDSRPNSSAGFGGTPTPLTKRPDWSSQRRSSQAASRPVSVGQSTSRPPHSSSNNDSRPSASHSRKSLPRLGSPTVPIMNSPSRRPIQSPESTAATMVHATQPPNEKSGEEDDDMEMSVPRSLGQDPTLLHRKRRSEYFRAALAKQRRDWIKSNYIPDPETSSSPQFSTIYSAYRKAHPKDTVKLSEFAEGIADVYPASAGVKLRPPKAAENVDASTPTPRPATTDVTAAVATSRKIQGESAMTVAPKLGLDGANDVVPNVEGKASQATSSLWIPQRGRGAAEREPAHGMSPSMDAQDDSRPSTSGAAPKIPQQSVRGITRDAKPILSNQDRVSPAIATSKVMETPRFKAKTNTAASRESDSTSVLTNGTKTKSEKHAVPTMNAFTEFAHAWKRIEPGGAFAPERVRQKQKIPTRLNVLEWEL